MTSFLQLVADDLRQRFAHDLSRVVVVFPNKRAGLFMSELLLNGEAEVPVWAPRYLTIGELFDHYSTLVQNDPIDTTCRICRLYDRLCKAHVPAADAVELDAFYGWAERILFDFDDVDKNMADADALFRNLSDLRELDNTDFLTPEQVEVLRQFFADFDPERRSEIRERFRLLWENLNPIYHALNRELAAEGLAYEGALYRRVVEDLSNDGQRLTDDDCTYAFVGFNVLDAVEHRLFSLFREAGKALFYWDYDVFYTSPERAHFEAGLFLRENLRAFPNALPLEHFDNLRHIGHVEVVAASTEVVQAQSVASWLERFPETNPRDTAIVLCNEEVLQPLLHAIPDSIREVNLTKGFPLGHTEVVTLVERALAEWERRTAKFEVKSCLCDLIERVNTGARALIEATTFSTERFESVLQSEAYYRMSSLLNRLLRIAEAERLRVNISTLRRLVRQLVRQSTIPFRGEPLAGLQVMGVLETRCLDFERVMMLSVNEEVLPQVPTDNSFIPYLLRRAFGLTTPERKTAVYAYYFYRLIQRTRHLRLLYNTSADGKGAGEMSRFITQLMVESDLPIEHRVITSPQRSTMNHPEEVIKPQDLLTRLARVDNEGRQYYKFSPSALNTYLRCPLLFYYKYVCGYKEPLPDSEDIQPNILGSIFHQAAEDFYAEMLERGGVVDPKHLEACLKDPAFFEPYIRRAFVAQQVEGEHLLEAKVVDIYLRNLLRHDQKLGRFSLKATERTYAIQLTLPEGSAVPEVTLEGTIDRIDLVSLDGVETLRVLDYKTGGKEERVARVEQLFTVRGADHRHYMFQTFLYCELLRDTPLAAGYPMAPALFFLNHSAREDFSPYLKIAHQEVRDYVSDAPEMRGHLAELVAEILDPTHPFTPPEHTKVCSHCPYFALCYQ